MVQKRFEKLIGANGSLVEKSSIWEISQPYNGYMTKSSHSMSHMQFVAFQGCIL